MEGALGGAEAPGGSAGAGEDARKDAGAGLGGGGLVGIGGPSSTSEVFKKKQAVAPATGGGAADNGKRKADEDDSEKRKRQKLAPGQPLSSGTKGKDDVEGQAGGIKDSSSMLSGSVTVSLAGDRAVGGVAGGKVLPKEVVALSELLRQAMQKHGESSTMRQIREQLIAIGYSRESVLEAKDIIKEVASSFYPQQHGGAKDAAGGKPQGGGEGDKVAPGGGRGGGGEPRDRVGRFTQEEDAILMEAIEKAIQRLHSGDVEAFKATLCGPKGGGADQRKKVLSEVWDDALKALPRRSRTSCYDRGRRLLQDTRRGNWSQQEIDKIQSLASGYAPNTINWQAIGQDLGRPASACKDIYRHRIGDRSAVAAPAATADGPQVKEAAGTGRWGEGESKAMVDYVRNKLAEGIQERSLSWIEVAKHVGTRSADQCRLHWRSVSSGRGHAASKPEGGEGGAGGNGKEWVWKRDRWTPDEDSELGTKVRDQVVARGLTHASEISWQEIRVKNRLPHMAKERFRRRGEDLGKEASLLERCEALQSPPTKGKKSQPKKPRAREHEGFDQVGAPLSAGVVAAPAPPVEQARLIPSGGIVEASVPTVKPGGVGGVGGV